MATDVDNRFKKKRQVINDCIREFDLSANPAVNEELLAYEGVPGRASKKLAFLIMAYKQEATTDELKRISDQPAGLVKALRNDGFLFQDNGKDPPGYYYKNAAGQTCRKITGFKSPKVEIRGRVKELIEKSVAACVSAIEIYNKPDFKYREETFSILLVNAWELLLKAKVLSDNNNRITSIQVYDQNGRIKRNRSGNPFTIDIHGAIQKLTSGKILDGRCHANIGLLIEIRNNAVHFVNKGLNFSKKVQEIGTASLRNYITAINEWFGRDLSQYNFYLMPMSFFHLTDIESSSVRGHNEQMRKMLEYFREVETEYPPDEDSPYSITLQIETRFVRSSSDSSVLQVRYTDKEDAPKVKVVEDDILRRKYPLTFAKLVDKLRKRYSDFKQDQKFFRIKRQLEDEERFCRVRYLNVFKKSSVKQKFYSTEIIKEFDKHYTRK